MRLTFFTIIVSLIFISGCSNEFRRFQDEAFAMAAEDKKIDAKEYGILSDRIKASHNENLTKYIGPDNEIKHNDLRTYLLKFFEARKLPGVEVWSPSTDNPTKFNIDVYIENSASMDGYVNGVTEFETAIYNLLGDFRISDICDSLNLNYINKQVINTKTGALPADIQDFVEKLEPANFRQRGGDRGVSDLKNILKTVVEKVDDKNAAILISDFVFSPGRKVDAGDYLNNQTVGIKIDFAEKLKKFDLSAIVLKLQSNFNGSYYDRTNRAITLNTKRPYYIWIFGSSSHIRSILDKKMLESIKGGGYQNKIVFGRITEPAPLEYKILLRPQIGEFEIPKGASGGEIAGAKISKNPQTKGEFGFDLAVDFSKSMQDANYFSDSSNYRLSDGRYILAIELISPNDQNLSHYTHRLKLRTKELQEEVLKVEVVGKTPAWITSSTSSDDSNIANDQAEKEKTFGLKYLIDGVSEAFYPQSNTNTINILTISIKQ